MEEPVKVLFVDDEPMVLRSLERILRARRVPWQVQCVNGAGEALERLAREPFDVIVSDLRMPEVSGVALLRQVRQQYPQVARLVLSGQASTHEGLEAMRVAHQCLAKPYDLPTLRATVDSLAGARRLIGRQLENDPLFAAVSQLASLPTSASAHQQLLAAASRAGLRHAVSLVETDPALTAKVLQLNRSAAFGQGNGEGNGQGNEAAAISEVMPVLHAQLCTAFLLGAEVCRPPSRDTELGFELGTWQRHSVMVARVASAVAAPALRARAFLAGILHDLGDLVAASLDASPPPQIDHAALGACLLALWGLDADLVEAVAHHHKWPEDRAPSPLGAALCLAEYVVTEAGFGKEPRGEFAMAPPNPSEIEHARTVVHGLARA